jgi:hypothetical protein
MRGVGHFDEASSGNGGGQGAADSGERDAILGGADHEGWQAVELRSPGAAVYAQALDENGRRFAAERRSSTVLML